MKRHGVLAAFIFLAYGSIAFGADPSSTNQNLKLTSLQMAALGDVINGVPLGANEIIFLEPVCALISKHSNLFRKDTSLQQWYIQLRGSPLLDLPEYNIAKDVISFHHYCYSKVVEIRYYREMDPVKKTFMAGYIAGGYSFVIEHQEYRPANWPYLPKLYVDLGKALMLGGKLTHSARAINAFEAALRNNKSFVPAMDALADVYEKLGEKSKALEYISEGLRYNPKSKFLKRRYEELGGKLPYPEPYPVSQTSSNTADQSPSLKTTPSENNKEEVGVTMTPTMPNTNEAEQAIYPKQNIPPAANSTEKTQEKPVPETGSQPSNNPYCRFCP